MIRFFKKIQYFTLNYFNVILEIITGRSKTFDWRWNEIPFNRISIVNYILRSIKSKSPRYLEIGCFNNELYDNVDCLDKTGVDPVSGGSHRMTSDLFFEKNKKKFDVIFVDGLHHYPYVWRDLKNGLNALNDDGWIIFHDTLPRSRIEQLVPRSSNIWTGDCWKVLFDIKQIRNVELKIVHADHGVAVIKKNGPLLETELTRPMFKNVDYDYYIENFNSLPVISHQEFVRYIDEGL